MEIVYKSHFKGFVKKQNRGFQLAIEDAIDRIKADPAIGKEETVDLTGFLIYKFAFKDREYLHTVLLTEMFSQAGLYC